MSKPTRRITPVIIQPGTKISSNEVQAKQTEVKLYDDDHIIESFSFATPKKDTIINESNVLFEDDDLIINIQTPMGKEFVSKLIESVEKQSVCTNLNIELSDDEESTPFIQPVEDIEEIGSASDDSDEEEDDIDEEEQLIDPEAEVELSDSDDEDPDPISYDNKDLEDEYKQFNLYNQMRDRNIRQKQQREMHLEGLFKQLTNGKPAPEITPTKFVKRRKKKDASMTPPSRNEQFADDGTPIRKVPNLAKMKDLEQAMRRVSISPAVNLKQRQRIQVEKHIQTSENKENQIPGTAQPNVNDSKRSTSAPLRIPAMAIRKSGIYTAYRNIITTVIGAHSEDIMMFENDTVYLIAAVIRLGMFIYPYTQFWKNNNDSLKSSQDAIPSQDSQDNSITSPQEAAKAIAVEKEEARKAFENGDIVRRFIDDSEDESLRNLISKWLDDVSSPRLWLDKRDNRHHKAVLVLSRLLITKLVQQNEENLLALADIPLDSDNFQSAKQWLVRHAKRTGECDEEAIHVISELEKLSQTGLAQLTEVKQQDTVQLPTGETVSIVSLVEENKQLKEKMKTVALELHSFYAQQLATWLEKMESIESQLANEKAKMVQFLHSQQIKEQALTQRELLFSQQLKAFEHQRAQQSQLLFAQQQVLQKVVHQMTTSQPHLQSTMPTVPTISPNVANTVTNVVKQ